MNRRRALAGLTTLTFGGAAAVTVLIRRREARRRQDEAMRSDFRAGRLRVVDGWIISVYEAETLGLEDGVPLDGAP